MTDLNPPITLDDLAETIEQLHPATGRVVRERIAADALEHPNGRPTKRSRRSSAWHGNRAAG